MHQSERVFRAYAKGQEVRRRAGLTGSCCRGAGHDEGKKEGSKGLPGRNSLSPLFAFSVWAVLHSEHVFRDFFVEICRTLEKREIHAKFAAGEKVTQKLPPS